MKYRWEIAAARPLEGRLLKDALGIRELTAACLVERGFVDPAHARRFLDPRLRDLADPFRLPQMDRAVERLLQARERSERIVLFGDYDVDGVTSTALLSDLFRSLGWLVEQYLPDRFSEGYGLTQGAVENCHARYPGGLLLAVDCGSTSRGPVSWLRERGVDTLVLDHHQPGDAPAEPVAFVNPQLGEWDRELCSAGLAFKLAHALLKVGRDRGLPGFAEYDLRSSLDLVALGTIADLVPLTGENRILASVGIQRLAASTRPGVVALREVAGVTDVVRVEQVGYQLGPRLNAAGRLDSARQALDLLLTPDAAKARSLATALDTCNRERQAIERQMSDDALAQVRARFNPERDFAIVEAQPHWHIGVVGIVASRVLREFHRPTLIIGCEGSDWRGSGRSIAGFDLAAALRGCDDLLLKHGGHAMAAGVTVEPSRVDELRERLNRIAQRSLTPEQLVPALRIDAEAVLSEMDEAALAEISRLEPFGQGNPAVQLRIPGLRHARPPQRIGKEQQHWRFTVTDGKVERECVWWNAGSRMVPTGDFELAGVPELNEYGGRRSVRIKVLDWRPVEPLKR
jgi:single-stranded-DNA-specific exonuclease